MFVLTIEVVFHSSFERVPPRQVYHWIRETLFPKSHRLFMHIWGNPLFTSFVSIIADELEVTDTGAEAIAVSDKLRKRLTKIAVPSNEKKLHRVGNDTVRPIVICCARGLVFGYLIPAPLNIISLRSCHLKVGMGFLHEHSALMCCWTGDLALSLFLTPDYWNNNKILSFREAFRCELPLTSHHPAAFG